MKLPRLHLSPACLVRLLLPTVVLVLGLVLTFALWRNARDVTRHDLETEFQAQSNILAHHMESRLYANIQVLRGVAALFASSDDVSRSEFRIYFETLHLEERYPGIQGVGLSLALAPTQLAAHTAAIRREGYPDYRVTPEGTRGSYSAIVYLEPFSGRNLRAFGYDMFSEPVRRAAMERARDSGLAALSGKVVLVQETNTDVQAGFLIYVPIYRQGQPHATLAERRGNLLGWAYSPLRMRDMMQGMLRAADFTGLRRNIDVEIYDGDTPTPEGLLYDSDDTHRSVMPVGAFHAMRWIDVAGERWTLRMTSGPLFDSRLAQGKANLTALAGIAVSVLLSLLLGVMARSQRRVVAALEDTARANRELAASEAKYHSLFESMTQGVFYQAADGRLFDCNPAALELFGLTHEQFLQRTSETPDWHVIHEDGTPASVEEHPSMQALRTGKPVRDVLLGVFNPQRRRHLWLLLNAIPQFRPGEERPYQVFVTIQDISERRAAENALRESEAKYRLVTENAQEWVFLNAPDGQPLYDSPSCATLTGYGPEDFEMDPGLIYRLLESEDVPLYMRHLADADSATPHDHRHELELRIRHRDGSVRWLAHVCQPVFDQDGKHLGNRGSNRDITDRKRLEVELDGYRRHLEELVLARTAELNRALAAAEAGNRAKSQFLANMSHELRTPMNAIIGMAHLAQGSSQEPRVRDKLQTVQDAARHLLDMINDILDLARLDEGQLPLVAVRFSCERLLEGIVRKAEGPIRDKGLRFDVEIDPALHGEYLGDPVRVAQIVNNFLDNAVKFTEQGHITLRVAARSESADPARVALRVEVEDTGIGISEEDQAHVFQPFVQVDASSTRKYGGSGLGLAINRRLATRMGGEVGVHSVPHQGSTFWFNCSLVKADGKSAEVVSGEVGPGDTGPRTVAESDAEAVAELEMLLESDDIRAAATLNRLRPVLLRTLGEAGMARLVRDIEVYDYQSALATLRGGR